MKGRLTYGHLPSWKRHGRHFCETCQSLKPKPKSSKPAKGWQCTDCKETALPAPLERVGAMLVGSKVLKRKEDPEEGQEDICASLSKCCGMT